MIHWMQPLNSKFTIVHDGDIYEVSLHGHVIREIVRYVNLSNVRQDTTYNELPESVKDEILDRVSKILME